MLRDLARRKAEIAHSDAMHERIRLWKCHNTLRPERPMVLLFPEGGWHDISQGNDVLRLRVEDPFFRSIEDQLRKECYQYAHFESDNVVDNRIVVRKSVSHTGWGLEPHERPSSSQRGAWAFDPVVEDFDDLEKLHHPEVIYNEQETMENLQLAREIFEGIEGIEVRLSGIQHISFHLMSHWTKLRGLEEVMMDMVAEPEFLHAAMRFLEEGNRGLLRQYEQMNLLDLNNDNTYHSSGGVGWTDELPGDDYDPAHVQPHNMWGSAESQELTGVSPEMHETFAMQYERRLIEPFGLAGYGCCDDLTDKLDAVKAIPNMRRISISPFADIDRCAPQLKGDYILSWKPYPTHLVGEFNEERIRSYMGHALEVAAEHGCVLEMILKDTHACDGQPERFDRWSRIAMESILGIPFPA